MFRTSEQSERITELWPFLIVRVPRTEVRQRRVLVLEDEPIVAMDIEATLSDAGFTVPPVIPSIADALKWLDANVPDVVILDIHLQDGSCADVVRRLVEKEVPFVVFTGSGPDEENVDPVFKTGLWIEKPAPAEQIVAVVRDLVAA
jgi:DNA-binding response OmpR family regulator